MSRPLILVAGATGNVGGELIGQLVSARVAVRGLVRSPDTKVPPGVEAVVGDLNARATLTPALEGGVSGLFLLPGFNDMPGLLARARNAAVSRVVLLSGGGAVATNPNNPLSRFQLDSEQAVRESTLAWTILRPHSFVSNALRWLPQLRAGKTVTLPFANVATAVIDPSDIAAVAAAALINDGHDGQIYRLSGPEPLRPDDQVRILGEVLGRDLQFAPQSDEEARTEMSASMPAEYVEAFFSFYVDGTLDESALLPTVREITGNSPRSFVQWAREHRDLFGRG